MAVLSLSASRHALASTLAIVRGGSYTGTFEAAGPHHPAITVETAEPVTIEDCDLKGDGPFIVAGDHAQLKLVRVRLHGRLPTRNGETVGRFLTASNPDSLEVADCDLNRTGGIYVSGFGAAQTARPTISIHDNRVHNVDGRIRDGAGGFRSHPHLVQFVQLDKVRHVGQIEFAWNQVINDPGDSAVEDVISIFKSSGLRESPIRIHNNYIRGAYPIDPAAPNYSGGGIMLGDGAEANPDDGPAYVEAFNNQVLDTTNYGIAISAGHHCTFHDNRIISSGLLQGRISPASQNVGAYIWDSNRKDFPHANFHHNGGRRNEIGWTRGLGRNEWWIPDATYWEQNLRIPGPITQQTVIDEWDRWQKKLAAHQATTHP